MSYQDVPLWGSPDPATAADVACVDADHRREADRGRVDDAIRRVAARDRGLVDPNAVRALLADANGALDVNPRTLSARYSGLSRAGVLRQEGWTVSTDTHGKNAGKPARVWRYHPEAA